MSPLTKLEIIASDWPSAFLLIFSVRVGINMNSLLRGFSLFAVSLLILSADEQGCKIEFFDDSQSKTKPSQQDLKTDLKDNSANKTKTFFTGLDSLEAAMIEENWNGLSSHNNDKIIWVSVTGKESFQTTIEKITTGKFLNAWKAVNNHPNDTGIQASHIDYWLRSPQIIKIAQEQTQNKVSDIKEEIFNIIFTPTAITVERINIIESPTESPVETKIITAKLIYSLMHRETSFYFKTEFEKTSENFPD